MKPRFYVTTPIYYVNAAPHIGHAYTTIVADVLNRFYRICGFETFFLTGTDEHGDKIVAAAEKAGETVQAYVDRISGLFRELWPRLNVVPSHFIRTTDPAHQRVVKLILNRVKDNGDIYFSDYEGLYCFGCERFYTERELVDGKCPDHQLEPSVIKEENYFFRMSRYQDWLLNHIHDHPDFIRPERYRNEVLSFLNDPLEDLCISRPKSRLNWGITLPFDENFVTYVWFDALINYISGIGFPDGRDYQEFWPCAQHLIAKDILKPHGIYWPCMLKSAGIEPYQHLNVHGYWNVNEGKMSKSVGNVVRPLELVEVYGLDAFRYFLLRDMVFGLDSEFSEEALVSRINADLANDLGNLVSRSLTMVHKYFRGKIPEPGPKDGPDQALKDQALGLIELYVPLMKGLGFHKALIAVWDLIGSLNKYIDTMAPWVLARSDKTRLSTVIYYILETLKIISVLLWPFMPQSMEKMQRQLGLGRIGEDFSLQDAADWGKEKPVGTITEVSALFPRIEEKGGKRSAEGAFSNQGKRGLKARKAPSVQRLSTHKEKGIVYGKGEKEVITIEDFQRMDLRVATIRKAETIEGSKKLLRLSVDLGEERTVVAGLVGHYSPESLVGKQVLVVANLQPVKLMGIESKGMILAAEDSAGLHLIVPETPAVPGSKVK